MASVPDAQDVADKFKDAIPVIINLQGSETDLSKRLIDFASGLTYALARGVSFEYQSINYPADLNRFFLPKDRRFNMSFTLAGVGSFSNFFGAFGGGTY